MTNAERIIRTLFWICSQSSNVFGNLFALKSWVKQISNERIDRTAFRWGVRSNAIGQTLLCYDFLFFSSLKVISEVNSVWSIVAVQLKISSFCSLCKAAGHFAGGVPLGSVLMRRALVRRVSVRSPYRRPTTTVVAVVASVSSIIFYHL